MNESILEQLDSQIKAMRELRRKEQKKANAEQQKATDQKCKTLVQQEDQYMNILSYIQENLGFVCSAELVAGLRTFFHKLESAVCYGDAEKEAVSQATDMFKGVQNETKKVWAKHFDALTRKTRGTLEIVRSIDPEKVMKCLKLIQDAEVWTMEKEVFERLRQALDGAEALIQGLGLDSNITDFLSKMAHGQATLKDLNEDIIAWLRKGNFEYRVKLSFR